MTISSEVRVAGPYSGDGSTVTFPFSFKTFKKTDVAVAQFLTATGDNVTLALDTDYSVSLSADQNNSPGGSITLLAAPDAAHSVLIIGDVAAIQPDALQNMGGYYPSVIENALDRAVILVLEQRLAIARSIQFPAFDLTTPSAVLPVAVKRVAKAMVFDATGAPIVSSEAYREPSAILTDAQGTTEALIGSITNPTAQDLTTVIFYAGTDFEDGVTTSISLPADTTERIINGVFLAGVFQVPETYTFADPVIAFSSPIPVGVKEITVSFFTPYRVGSFTQSGAGAIARTFQDKLRDFVSPRDFGAKFDGTTDDTVAIQCAIDAAGQGGTVMFPNGTTVLSATLNGHPQSNWISESAAGTVFRRYTDYGDTVAFSVAVGILMRGIYMFHGTHMLVPGDVALTEIVTTPTYHLRLSGCQGVLIEDCTFWRMPRQVVIEDGSLVTINRCKAQGTWDSAYPAAQEGVSGIAIGTVGYTQIVKVTDCYLGGSGNGPRAVTFTATDGSATETITQHVGNKFGIYIGQCEDLLVSGNYMGGNQYAPVYAEMVGGSTNLDWRFIGNFGDGGGPQGAIFSFATLADGTYLNGLTMHGNVFNGEQQTYQGVVFYNGTGNQPVVTNFSIVGNTFQAIVGSGMMFYNARGGVVSGNSVTGYNSLGASAGADLTYACGMYFGPRCEHINVSGNVTGGTVNSTGSPSTAYQGIYYKTASGSVQVHGNTVIGSGAGGAINGRVDKNIVTVTAGNYSMLGNEDLVLVNRTANASTQISPPANVPPGFSFRFKDGKGDAATNPIQFAGIVDGVTNPTYSAAYIARELTWNGTQWNVTG